MNHVLLSQRWLLASTLLVASNVILTFIKPVVTAEVSTSLGLYSVGVVTLFAFLHGGKRYGWKSMAVFFVAIFAVSWSYESLSIVTGFPFGHYHYTTGWSPMLGLVPLAIMPSYFSMGYLSWVIASVLLDKTDASIRGSHQVLMPVLSSFVMVMWDICMDPLNSTLGHFWIWHDGGSYFGVPFVNYLGWFLCVLTFYLFFAYYLTRVERNEEGARDIRTRAYWLLPVMLYGSHGIEFLANHALSKPDVVLAAENGREYWTGDIYGTTALMTLFTMGFIVFYASARLFQDGTLESGADVASGTPKAAGSV